MKRLTKFLYSEEVRKSHEQLKKDFNNDTNIKFSENLNNEYFIVVRIRWIGALYVHFDSMKRLLRLENVNEVPFPANNLIKEFDDFISAIKYNNDNFKKLIKDSRSNFLMTIFIPLIIILSAPIIFWILIRSVVVLVRIYKKLPSAVGYFFPLYPGENRVVIKAGGGRNCINEEVLITHEHLHLLQHRANNFKIKKSRCRDLIISEKWKDDRYLSYLMEANELEARLHEVIISFYNKNKKLPLQLEDFLVMLSGNSLFGYLVIDINNWSRDIKMMENIDQIKYEIRSLDIADEIYMTLLSIGKSEIMYKFILEVWTVMYANILGYYGCLNIQEKFQSQIMRPNLYDQLYLGDFK